MGYAPTKSKNTIFIYVNDSRLLKKSTLKKLINHELAHVFTNKINSRIPTWIKEGVSIYLANQITFSSISKGDWNFIYNPKRRNIFGHKWNYLVNKINAYNSAGIIIQSLIELMGKQKFICLIKLYEPSDNLESAIKRCLGRNNRWSFLRRIKKLH